MNSKQVIKMGATAALAVFGAQAAHTLAGKRTGMVGIATKLAGGIGGVWLAAKLA